MLERAQKGWSTSKSWWRWLLAIQGIAAIVGVVTAWTRPEHGVVAVVLPVLAVLIPVTALEFRARANRAFAAAEMWRRAYLLKDSLGHEPTGSEYLALALDAPTSGPNDQTRSSPYFASTLPHGYPRLMENLGESAFHTSVGADAMAGWFRLAVATALIVSVTALLAALYLPLTIDTHDQAGLSSLARAAPQVASVFGVVLTLILSGQAFELMRAYTGLARTARLVMERALVLRGTRPTAGATLSLLGTYDAAIAGAGVPIFATRDPAELDRDWERALARTAPESSTAQVDSKGSLKA